VDEAEHQAELAGHDVERGQDHRGEHEARRALAARSLGCTHRRDLRDRRGVEVAPSASRVPSTRPGTQASSARS
jgi:hypothetical protein